MLILLDVDGVVADFIGHLHQECGVKSKVREWDLRASLTEDELAKVDAAGAQPGFCSAISWYPGAALFLYELMEVGSVFAVTAPWHSDTWDSERRLWLKTHLPAWRVISCAGKAKSIVRGDVLIEDHPGTAAEWLRAHPEGYAVLMDRPWNQPESQTYRDAALGEAEGRLLRAHSYDEALGLVEGVKIVFAAREGSSL